MLVLPILMDVLFQFQLMDLNKRVGILQQFHSLQLFGITILHLQQLTNTIHLLVLLQQCQLTINSSNYKNHFQIPIHPLVDTKLVLLHLQLPFELLLLHGLVLFLHNQITFRNLILRSSILVQLTKSSSLLVPQRC